MFVRKQRRTATIGITTQSYSNTNQTNNTPVIEVAEGGDLNHLNPTLTQPPNNPDTITPVVTPETEQINLLLPVGGFVGTVYVVLAKPTPNAAVVVVEVTNDNMDYNPAIDKLLLDPEGEPPDDEEPPPSPNATYSPRQFSTNLAATKDSIIYVIHRALAPYEDSVVGINVDKVADILVARMTTEIKRTSYVYTTNGTTQPIGEILSAVFASNINFVTLNYGTSATTGDIKIPLQYTELFGDVVKIVQLGEQVDIQSEIYRSVGNTTVTKQIPVNLYIEQLFSESANNLLIICFLTQFIVTVKYKPAEYCHPLIDEFEIDTSSFKIVNQYNFELNLETEEAKTKPPKTPVRRGYINIGGKIVYLYTVGKQTSTTVFVNYDGTNYGVIVQTPNRTAVVKRGKTPPTASYTNNINGYNLNAAQQTLLQTCLPIPDDTLQGGFKVLAPTTETNFKSYGFESIFYRTATAYNNTTIKGCAVYGL